MGQFDVNKWMKDSLLNRHLSESLANELGKVIPEDTSYKDFAQAVAKILREDYGSHLYGPFMEVLHGALGIEESLNEGELEDEAKKLDLTLTKKDGKIEVGGDSIDKDDFEKIAKKLGYKVDREVEKGEYDRLYISK